MRFATGEIKTVGIIEMEKGVNKISLPIHVNGGGGQVEYILG